MFSGVLFDIHLKYFLCYNFLGKYFHFVTVRSWRQHIHFLNVFSNHIPIFSLEKEHSKSRRVIQDIFAISQKKKKWQKQTNKNSTVLNLLLDKFNYYIDCIQRLKRKVPSSTEI